MVHSKTVASAADLSAPTVARQFYGFTALQIAPSAHAKGSYFSRTGCAPFSCSICWMPDAARCAVLAPLELGGQVILHEKFYVGDGVSRSFVAK